MTVPGARLIKCVVWDLDETLLTGVFLESPETPPPADPAMVAVLAELDGRGILHAIASRNPPTAAIHAAAVTGWEFAAAECGWDAKSAALRRIAAGLGIDPGTCAFVDDDPLERAEVAAALPQVMVLAPEDMPDAVAWPEFQPPVITGEGRRRGALYAARRRRAEAEQQFCGGGREEFLRWADTRIALAPAQPADAPRLEELAARTRQFNSAARAFAPGEFAAELAEGRVEVITAWLADSFTDDGLVGAAVVDHAGPDWTVEVIMMSCRAMGRGVIDALLAWLLRRAAAAGASAVDIPCVLTDRNVPLRLALAAAGFRARPGQPSGTGAPPGPAGQADSSVVFRAPVPADPPDLPDWVTQGRPFDYA